jgi:AcrR family transcriptional regulator
MKKGTGRPSALQDRSLVTRDLLCDAAEDLLREGGLALCTIQDVAARSGRSAGSVYRRFGDKDGMIEAVIERYLARTLSANETNFRTLTLKCPDLSGRVKALVDGAVAGRRREGKLIEAFREAAAASSSDALSAAFERTRTAALELAKRALRECSTEIAHPNKARAIDFAVSMLAGAMETMMRPPAALGDRVIRAELHAMLMSYLTTGASARA